MAALQELEDIIRKETYHVVPIMESRQGFTNLTATVQRIGQAGRDAVDWARACLRDQAEARALADKAGAVQKALEADLLELQDRLREEERLTAAARADADASHGREQAALVLLEELRAEMQRQRTRAERLSALPGLHEQGLQGQQGGEGEADARRLSRLSREQDLAEELAHVKELLRSTYEDQDAIARRASFANLRANKLTEELAAAHAAHALEARHKENAERDAGQLRRDLEVRAAEVQALQAQLDAGRERAEQQDKLVREAGLREDRLRKRADQLQRQVERGEQQATALQQLLEQRAQREEEGRAQLQVAELELARQRRQMVALERARDAAAARLRCHDAKLAALQAERDALSTARADLRRELESAREELAAAERRALQQGARAAELESGRARLSRVTEQQARVLRSKQKLWDDLSREYALCRKKARQDETARERLRQEKQQLASSLADKNLRLEMAVEEQHLRDIKLATYQREMADSSAAQLKLSAQLDGARSQLGLTIRELAEERERHQAAAGQVKVLDKANEQLREEAATREKQTVHLERVLARARTEAHGLRAEAQRLEAEAAALRAQRAEQAAEQRRLADQLREADAERAELRREAEARLGERDVIAAMLVRRNDEVRLLRDQGRLLQDALVRGRGALLAARQDARLLGLEVRRLRAERRHLAAQLQNAPQLRAQLYRALQDLTRDQVRLRALEDELSCPLNVHRWRKLEGVDPPAYELLVKVEGCAARRCALDEFSQGFPKTVEVPLGSPSTTGAGRWPGPLTLAPALLGPQVRLLQKRLLRLSAAGLRREAQLRHTEALYSALRRAVCPSEGLPGPQGIPRHTRLASRGRHLKALIAEVSALEALADQKTATRLLADLRFHLPDLDPRKRKAPDEGLELEEDAPRAKQPSPRLRSSFRASE
ncbi:Cilia- and flagella-associated protein 58 [Frankliniella fusca]|uniref:Cilia- and flagella-associated protein 58 n=1 Tax=Frankliniella fusca TaxID=407009 RepID=A0AAE1H0J8_9NEOP|nr:Cilia- and flagella-associated protein 58 [Frankliniella fusca]